MSVSQYLSDVVKPAAHGAADAARGKARDAAERAREAADKASASLQSFIDEYRERLHQLFSARLDPDRLALQRGLPPFALKEVRGNAVITEDPLAAYIPSEYGGRGARMHESLAVLEQTGYESLPLCLMVGINGGLFLHPVAKYGHESIKKEVFSRFLDGKSMGGLMITEPEYGSDALHMKTFHDQTARGTYKIKGVKHWGGLTGWADFWLLTAREKTASGNLSRDIDFFLCDVTKPGQHIEVEEIFPNLGLYMIPYGRNRIDVEVPQVHRLQPQTTGIKMLLDVLHRSRLQFPGMGMGFLRRMRDEAVLHSRERHVGGKSLDSYDQVQARLARLQASATACAAMCAFTSENGGLEKDVSGMGLAANSAKTVVTDMMHEAAQSLLQLVGAKGYRQDHIAGRSITDSRPFQIFEGSNDILYQQVAESVIKQMRRLKETNLYSYLTAEPLTERASDYFKDVLDFKVDSALPQRKLVQLGEIVARVVSMEMTIEIGERGYRSDLVKQSLDSFRADVGTMVAGLRQELMPNVIDDYNAGSDWLPFVNTAPTLAQS